MTINEKLLTIQKKIGKITKESTNPFFKSKYFDINTLLEHVTPILNEHGLILTQPLQDGNVFSVITDTESKETITSSIALPELSDPQKIGSCITYYRRYTLQSLLALQSEDDDANLASKPINKSETKKEYPKDDKPWITEVQFNTVCKRAKEDLTVIDKAIDTYKIKKVWFNELVDIKRKAVDKKATQEEFFNESDQTPF